jgi:hypothetical protein
VIDQVRRCFGHAPRIARGTHATTFAGVGDQKIVLALVAVGAGEAVGEDAAFEIAAEGSLDMGRRCFTVLAAGELQPGFEVGLDDAIPQRPLGTAALVALGCGRGALSGGCHRGGPSWSGDRDRILYISSALGRRSTAAAVGSARTSASARTCPRRVPARSCGACCVQPGEERRDHSGRIDAGESRNSGPAEAERLTPVSSPEKRPSQDGRFFSSERRAIDPLRPGLRYHAKQ